jgi:hypothetical protein
MDNNTWQKRASTKFKCSSGNEVSAHRPGPSLALKAQRFLPILQKVGVDTNADPEGQLAAILKLSDDELDKLTDFARIIIVDAVDHPIISLAPKQGQYHPDDLPIGDFWELFIWIAQGCPSIPVEMKEGETTVEVVTNFPLGQEPDVSVSGDSEQIQ